MTLSILTVSVMDFSIMTTSSMTLSIMLLIMTQIFVAQISMALSITIKEYAIYPKESTIQNVVLLTVVAPEGSPTTRDLTVV
jgi:hypothetical protein